MPTGEELFTIENFLTLLMLIALQGVLGFDNLLYISLESKRAPEEKRKFVQRMGIGIAILLRIVLLFVLVRLLPEFQDILGEWKLGSFLSIEPNVHSLIVIAGGVFILYTAVKEIWHMIKLDAEEAESEKKKRRASVGGVITMIVIMNIVFSFDSILSAMALSDNFVVMATAIVVSGLLMIWLSDRVSKFLAKNRMYEVLGLFILFLVGVMLLSEGGHMANLEFFGNHITEMSKTTFYFILVVLVLVDIVQGRYQKKLNRKKSAEAEQNETAEITSSEK